VKSARLLASGTPVKFVQDDLAVRFTGLPDKAPDPLITVLEVECESEPTMSHEAMRDRWPRFNAGFTG
jgi:alpha-L-fucosidase